MQHLYAGQGLLPLEALDKKCEHRATVDLLDEKGRKATGGTLTVVARLREPLTGNIHLPLAFGKGRQPRVLATTFTL